MEKPTVRCMHHVNMVMCVQQQQITSFDWLEMLNVGLKCRCFLAPIVG